MSVRCDPRPWTRDQLISAVEWGVIVLVAAADLAFWKATGLRLERWEPAAKGLLLILAIWPILKVVTRVTGFAPQAAFLGEIPPKLLAFGAAANLLTYFLANSGVHLYDDVIAQVDRALGFDWPVACRWTAAHPAILAVLRNAYSMLLVESGIVLYIVAVFYPERARRFSTALITSTAFTIALAQVLPAVGPFGSFNDIGLPAACFSDLTALQGADQFLKLRTGALDSIDFTAISGLIAFPSYHATAAILLTYFLRGVPVLFACALTFNAAMIAATPVVGGHYMTDILGGVAVAVATIWIIGRLDRLPMASVAGPITPPQSPAETGPRLRVPSR